jgi:hypothetical protein
VAVPPNVHIFVLVPERIWTSASTALIVMLAPVRVGGIISGLVNLVWVAWAEPGPNSPTIKKRRKIPAQKILNFFMITVLLSFSFAPDLPGAASVT